MDNEELGIMFDIYIRMENVDLSSSKYYNFLGYPSVSSRTKGPSKFNFSFGPESV